MFNALKRLSCKGFFSGSCLAVLILVLVAGNVSGQKTFFGEAPVSWEEYPAPSIPEDLSKYEVPGLVIINDQTEFYFYGARNEKLVRNITYKINTAKGLETSGTLKLPESFDQAYDAGFKQGRYARIKAPFIREYAVTKFSARKFSRNRWTVIPFELKYEKIRWIKSSGDFAGEFMNEDLSVFRMQGLEAGDIVQVVYEATFNSDYGNNLFYFNSAYPKLNCEYTFIYRVDKRMGSYNFILPMRMSDTCIKKTSNPGKDYAVYTCKIGLKNLKGINYAGNSFQGNTLPHVFADFRFYRVLSGSFPLDGGRVYEFEYFRPRNFEWVIFADTTNHYTKVYDKQFAAIRKFVSKMPPVKIADTTNVVFFKALCDTFNNFRYISNNQLFYNEANLRDVYSGDHILKRRLVEQHQWKLYKDILNDNKVFYNVVNIQDRRFGEHSVNYRTSYAYEHNLIAIPSGTTYIYFMPRYNGLKYHLNELPFYLEGSLALLNPQNFQEESKNKNGNFFKFIKTHKGTCNENTRTENVSVAISLDSLKADLVIKEALSGQFSTLLRHLYLNEAIDSTVPRYYYKKCTDKPLASGARVKLSSKMTDFPFRYNFNCTERIKLEDKNYLSLENWFSFLVSRSSFPELPTHDYYMDFDFSDSYNFLLNFNEPVSITNAAFFKRNLNNEFFELESEVLKQSETSWLLKVKLVVKQMKIPESGMDQLEELLKELDALNGFSLELAKK